MIRVEGITKEYRSGRGTVRALSDVTFTLGKGELASVFGKSGSGKTTLLNCLGGLERPGSGRVEVLGRDLVSMSSRELSLVQRKEMGFVFQRGNLLSFLSVADNISLPLSLNGASRGERKRRVTELLEKVGLPGSERALPHELSGGEAQRVAVARALAHRPSLLMADEPTASLDTATGKKVTELIFELGSGEGCTVVLSTHDPGIIRLSERVLEMRDGRLAGPDDSSGRT